MFEKKYLKNNYPLILIGLYPLGLILGTFISELITFIIIIIFLWKSYCLKNWKWTQEVTFYNKLYII
jgi:hypothetical protein